MPMKASECPMARQMNTGKVSTSTSIQDRQCLVNQTQADIREALGRARKHLTGQQLRHHFLPWLKMSSLLAFA
jgi:hypothetical protein